VFDQATGQTTTNVVRQGCSSGQDTTNVARQQVTVITAKQLLTLRGRAAPLFLLQSMFSAVGVELNVSELKSGSELKAVAS